MRRFPFILFIVLSITLAAMLLQSGVGKNPATSDNAPFPTIHVTSFDGKTLWKPEALKGRVTLINFYASWCAPCAMELPELDALQRHFPKLHLAGIAWNDEPKTLTQWLGEHGNPFTSLWIDKKGDATIDLGIKGIPETILVDSNGTIRFRVRGTLTAEMREGEFGALIKQLLSEAKDGK